MSVLGDFDTLQSFLKVENAEIPVLGDDGKPENVYKKNVPDHVLVQGTLESGAVASIAYRFVHMNAAIGEVGIRWIISGTDGEIEITTDQSQWQIFSPKSKLRIKLNGQETEEVTLPNAHSGYAEKVSDLCVNTANILDAFAKGDTTRYADFESALKTHRLLDRIVEKSGFTW
jgi:predicted dehydrogenase